jgi:hypothetical protein
MGRDGEENGKWYVQQHFRRLDTLGGGGLREAGSGNLLCDRVEDSLVRVLFATEKDLQSDRQIVYLGARSGCGRTRCSRVCGRPVSANRGSAQLDSRISVSGSGRLTVLDLCNNREITLNERTCETERCTLGQPKPTLRRGQRSRHALSLDP